MELSAIERQFLLLAPIKDVTEQLVTWFKEHAFVAMCALAIECFTFVDLQASRTLRTYT